jgi:hypothetical protein
MERIDTAPPRTGPADIPSLAPLAALPELLEAVRSERYSQQELDALVAGLQVPVAEEDKRARADLLLSLLEDPALGPLTTSTGLRVRTAAFEALTAMGFPYALEVPPSVLAQLRRDQPVQLALSAKGGLGLAGVAFLLPTLLYLVTADLSVDKTPWALGLLVLFLLGPAGLELLGLKFRLRFLQVFGNVVQWFIGALSLLVSLIALAVDSKAAFSFIALAASVSMLLSAFLLRHRSEDFPLEDE